MKEKFRRIGIDALEPHEILEMMLFYCIPQGDTNELAHILLNRFGGFSEVFNASYDELLSVNGVGENTAFFIKFIPQLISMFTAKSYEGLQLSNSETMCKFFMTQFLGANVEQLRLLCLYDDLTFKKSVLISEGDACSTSVNIQKIVQSTLSASSSRIVLAHNHPNSSCEPSKADLAVHGELESVLKSLNIELVDNIVVGKDGAKCIKSRYVKSR
ncbi:MAG: RadC family protein [Oscillospiraceae bacterium]|nr:RadC family protein [Oscillospiraceae bacterium]